MTESADDGPGIDATRPAPARMYDYFLGGTANFEVDRIAAESIREKMPELHDAAWANRGFLQRSARWLAEHGVRQFLDIGAGLPTQNNTHDAVHAVAPDARVVYVDNDPMVIRHAGQLLDGTANTAVVLGDLRDPDAILTSPGVRRVLDLGKPIGVLLVAVLHFIPDAEDPWALVRRLMASLAPGSYLGLSHATAERQSEAPVQAIRRAFDQATEHATMRDRVDVERFFDGLELVPPYAGAGPEVTFIGQWGAEDPAAADSDGSRWAYCGVARRP